jgi:hypothetical protein
VSGGCPRCAAPLPDQHVICRACCDLLRGQLGEVPTLLVELDVTISRQGSRAESLGHHSPSAERPSPYDLGASGARADLVGVVDRYTELARRGGREGWTTERRALALSRWPVLASWLHAPHLARDVHGALARGWRAVDRPADVAFVGWCPGPGAETSCGRALYATEGRLIVRCPGCRSEWSVTDSRALLLAHAHSALAPAATIAAALGIPSATIRGWRRVGKLAVATSDDGRELCTSDGRPMYRLADVVALVGDREGSASS